MMIDFAGGHGVQQTQLCSYCTRQAALVQFSSVLVKGQQLLDVFAGPHKNWHPFVNLLWLYV